MPGEEIEGKVTVFAEGSLGQLAEDVVEKMGLNRGRIHQIQSLGVKEVIKLPADNAFGANHVVHTFGFPLADVFGGGTLYSLDKNTVAVALVLALDWKYADLSPQQELQVFKSHRTSARPSKAARSSPTAPRPCRRAATSPCRSPTPTGRSSWATWPGTPTWQAQGLAQRHALGDAGGPGRGRGHRAERLQRRDAAADGEPLEASPVVADLKRGKNYRQMFTKGRNVYFGAPLSLIQRLVPGRIKTEPDHLGTKRVLLKRDYRGGYDRLSDVALSGTIHREEEPSHISISGPDGCAACFRDFGVHPCEYFCPPTCTGSRRASWCRTPRTASTARPAGRSACTR